MGPLATSAMRAYIGSRTGDIAVGVKNALSDRTYLWNGRSEQVTASIVKVGLMDNVTPSQAWGVGGGVPSGVSVALKNGGFRLAAAGTSIASGGFGAAGGGI